MQLIPFLYDSIALAALAGYLRNVVIKVGILEAPIYLQAMCALTRAFFSRLVCDVCAL